MDCPVCKKKDIAEIIQYCPNCETDLAQFSLLETIDLRVLKYSKENSILKGKLVELGQRHQRLNKSRVSPWWMRGFFLLGICFLWQYFSTPSTVEPLTEPAKREVQPVDSNKIIQDFLKNTLVTQVDSFYYKIRKGETFWEIASMIYGDASKAVFLQSINPRFEELNLPPNDSILIILGCD